MRIDDDKLQQLVGKILPLEPGVEFCREADEGNFVCTRRLNHAGPHVAHTSHESICNIWEDDPLEWQ